VIELDPGCPRQPPFLPINFDCSDRTFSALYNQSNIAYLILDSGWQWSEVGEHAASECHLVHRAAAPGAPGCHSPRQHLTKYANSVQNARSRYAKRFAREWS
jgi:hypothetical protein